MSSSTALTGVDGDFLIGSTHVARTTLWSVNPKLASTSEWGDSDSEGYTNRAAGRKDCTFNAEGKYSTDTEQFDIFQPGDILVAVLWMNHLTLYWDFPRALNSDFNLSVNIDSCEVVGWNSAWGADGKFFRPGQAGITSRTYA